jgi:CNT family concentrative nucleoside transporter
MDLLIACIRSLFGISILLGIALLFSRNRKAIDWSIVVKGILIQISLAILVTKVDFVYQVFNFISNFFVIIYNFTSKGTEFLFGKLATDEKSFGFIFAIRVLPSIVFFSALTSLLYYLKILPIFVNSLSKIFSKVFKTSGPESLAMTGNIFLGHTESALLIKPYIQSMTSSELYFLIVGGFSTISGSVLAACVGLLGGSDPIKQHFFATQFLTASIIAAPAAIVIAKIIYPETESLDKHTSAQITKSESANVFDSIASGTTEGMNLAFNVGAGLLVFISLVGLINFLLSDVISYNTGLSSIVPNGGKGLTMQYLLGVIFSPVAWAIGVDYQDMLKAGQLLGEKIVINEFFAYSSMKGMIEANSFANTRTVIMMTFALCGFANFGSIGIMMGAVGTLAPQRRGEVARLSILALLGGTLASLMTACIAGIIYLF